MMPVINQLWPAGSADTRMHDRPARPTAFCWNQNCPRICGEKSGQAPSNQKHLCRAKKRQLHYPLSRLLHQKYASVLLLSMARHKFVKAPKSCLLFCAKTPRLPVAETGAFIIFY